MSRKRKGRPISGVLLFFKNHYQSSNHALQQVRRLFQAEKAGHGGTLDPFAEGLLPILFGEATKFGQYLLNSDKGYRVNICFGRETTTDDIEGETLCEKPVPNLSRVDWEAVSNHFQGQQQQIPPIFSALKIAGKRAYDLARAGEVPEMTPREITIHHLQLLSVTEKNIVVDVHCSKGTYIRALARDIGRFLGSAAYASALTRTFTGHFGQRAEERIYRWEDLEAIADEKGQEALDQLLLPVASCVQDFPKLHVPPEKSRFIRHGNDIETPVQGGKYALYDQGEFFGVGRVEMGRLYPERLYRQGMESKDV